MSRILIRGVLVCWLPMLIAACGSDETAKTERGRGGLGRGGAPSGIGGRQPAAAIPVEVASVERRMIASYIETNGILEAENEVDLVARTGGPVMELLAEEGMKVSRGQLLARLDDREIRTRLEIARVAEQEAKLAFDRAERLRTSELLSPEVYEEARADMKSTEAQVESEEIQLGYTEIRAPFAGLIVARYVDRSQYVGVNAPTFRLSDFTPLLCAIQVPELELSRLSLGQAAYLTTDAWPDERFEAQVLRINPVVDASTGTVKVTLEMRPDGRLRPGMFMRVYVRAEEHPGALVIPKSALSLESIGDTVYVVMGETVERREVSLGFREGKSVEVTDGLAEAEAVVVVGQDGLADGAPVHVLTPGVVPSPATQGAGSPGGQLLGEMTPERLARVKEMLESQGLSDEEIDQRIAVRQASGAPPGGPGGGPRGERQFDPANMTPERLEQIKERMRARGLSEKEIEERLEQFGKAREGDSE